MYYRFSLIIGVVSFVAYPQVTLSQGTADVKALLVHPAAAPKPVLKYRLLPRVSDQQHGNAAVWYGKVTADRSKFFAADEIWSTIHESLDAPLNEIRANEAISNLTRDNTIYHYLVRGGRASFCEWHLPIRTDPYYSILLPEVQQSRDFSRYLALRARRQFADGDIDGAIETLQTGIMLGRHIAESETLVSSLVGLAISNMMVQQVFDFIQAPDAPNLYWALTTLPDPLIDSQKGIEAEFDALFLTHPSLFELDEVSHDAQFWQQQVGQLWKTLRFVGEGREPDQASAAVEEGYPQAKDRLIAAGWPRDTLDVMSRPQVYLLDGVYQFRQLRDDVFKWLYLPYPVAAPGMKEVQAKVERMDARTLGALLAKSLLPSVQAVLHATALRQREIVACRTVEAIRMHAAENGAGLPGSLSDIVCVPTPVDPASGKPLHYVLADGVAVLTGPPIAENKAMRIEVRLAE